MPAECTEKFDWIIYRDGTAAGLAILLPVPFVDDLLEDRLRNQMIVSIADRRGKELGDEVVAIVNRRSLSLSNKLKNLLLWPIRLPMRWLVGVSRKVVYVLTVRRAVVTLAHYWRRAYLLDYMVCADHLNHIDTAQPAVDAMRSLLAEEQADDLSELAIESISAIPQWPTVLRTTVRAFRPNRDEQLGEAVRTFMADNWSRYASYFDTLGVRYEQAYRCRLAERKDASHPASIQSEQPEGVG